MAEDKPSLVEIGPEDRARVMKFARYTALSMDRMCGTILELTKRLEEANLIPTDRKTKRPRDIQMKKHARQFAVDKETVENVLEQLKGSDHPNPEEIVSTLFRDLDVPHVRRMMKSAAKEEAEE